MGRKRKGDKINGWANLDKPYEMTSTQALSRVRRILNAQKLGHAGTLDPLATGVLPIALGEATKTIPFVQDALKTYSFTIKWGEQTDTDDSEGDIIKTSDERPSESNILKALQNFTGHIEQVPPKFSAIKINGQRAYDLARDGEDIELKSRGVYIEKLKLLEARKDDADFEMVCGKGTYVRSLARDLALDLGTFGHISALRRLQVGAFTAKDAISLEILEQMSHSAALERAVLPVDSALDDILALSLKQDEAAQLRNGQVLSFVSKPDFQRLINEGFGEKDKQITALAKIDDTPVAIVEIQGPKVKPVRILNI